MATDVAEEEVPDGNSEDKDKEEEEAEEEDEEEEEEAKDKGNNKDDAKETLPDGDSKDKGNNKDDAQEELPAGDSTEEKQRAEDDAEAKNGAEAAEIGGAPDGPVLDFEEELYGGDFAMTPLAEPQIFSPPKEVTTGGRKETTSGAGAAEPIKCKVCGIGIKKDKQQFGTCCEADVRAARRDAQSQGPQALASFKRLQKLGNAEFITSIQTYRAKCQGNGRGWKRPAFAWVAYTMAIEMASRVQVGTKQIWLTKRAFINFMISTQDISEPMAQQRWMVELENAEVGKVNAAKTEILWPIERFVMDFHEKSHSERVEMGTKPIKNPNDSQINDLKNLMGTDHQSAAQMGQSLGLGAGVFNGSAANPLCVSSAPTPQQEQEQQLHEAEQLKKKEEKEKKLNEKKEKKAEAKFQRAAVMASLQPELAKWGASLVEKSATAVTKAHAAIDDMKKIPALCTTHGALIFLF